MNRDQEPSSDALPPLYRPPTPEDNGDSPAFRALYIGSNEGLRRQLDGQICLAYPNGGLVRLVQDGFPVGLCTVAEVIRLDGTST
jgi:hypothetical protein